jgi:hypothetical protein
LDHLRLDPGREVTEERFKAVDLVAATMLASDSTRSRVQALETGHGLFENTQPAGQEP